MQGGKVFCKASRQKELNDSAAFSIKMELRCGQYVLILSQPKRYLDNRQARKYHSYGFVKLGSTSITGLKPVVRKDVRVRLPPSAPDKLIYLSALHLVNLAAVILINVQ